MIRLLEQARVLVTGATGFVGQHLCRELAARGTATYGLSRSASRDTLPSGVTPIAADVTRMLILLSIPAAVITGQSTPVSGAPNTARPTVSGLLFTELVTISGQRKLFQ